MSPPWLWGQSLLPTLDYTAPSYLGILYLSQGHCFWARLFLRVVVKGGMGLWVMTTQILAFYLPEARPHCASQHGLESSILPWSTQCLEGMCHHDQLPAMGPLILIVYFCTWASDSITLQCAQSQGCAGYFLACVFKPASFCLCVCVSACLYVLSYLVMLFEILCVDVLVFRLCSGSLYCGYYIAVPWRY